MKYPVVYNPTKFDPSMDIGINSRVIRSIFEIMWVTYRPGEGFTAGFNWRVAIRDRHDDEEDFHYVLELGEGPIIEDYSHGRCGVAYVDYHSVPEAVVKMAPGKWLIEIWIEPKASMDSQLLRYAEKINAAYVDAMRAELPDYEILSSRLYKF